MNTIEERVLEMRFDNKQFTSETKNTLSMLERLKAALQFSNSGKEIDKMAKSMSSIRFDGIAAGVEALTNRFSTFGIVGMRAIENVTDGLMNKLSGAVSYVKNAVVSGGVKRAMNIENAHFQLQALLKDEEKVQAVMDNANESVDGTAYAYDEAAKAASMFAASGIQAGDEMLGALKGITGVAAMTNAPFEAISMIFTTVAGNGRLMGDQLLQLSSRGLNAASTLADYFKEVQKQSGMTEEKVREMVSKGEISFKTFAEAMNWAFGDSAKRANETFTGSMSNMRSALARIGAGFVSPLIEQNGVLVDMFNTLRETFNTVKSALVFDQATSSVEGFAKALGMSSKEAEKFYSKVEKKGYVTIKNLESIQKHNQDGYSQLRDYFNGINDGSIRASYAVTKVVEDLTKGNEVTRKDIRKFVKQGKVDFSIFSNAMEEAFGTQKQKLSKRFTDFAIKNLDDLREGIESLDVEKGMKIAYKGIDSVINIVKALASVIKPVATSFSNVFLSFNSDDVMGVAKSVEQFTKKLTLSEESAEKLQKTFTGVFDIVALLGDGLIELIKAFVPFGSNVKDSSDSLLDLSANLGENLSKFAQWVRTNPKIIKGFQRFKDGVKALSDGFSAVGKGIGEFIEEVRKSEKVQKVITKTGEIFTSVGEGIYDILKTLTESFSEFNVQIYAIDLSTPIAAVKGLEKAFSALNATLMKNEGFAAIVIHLREMGYEAQHVFSVGNLQEKIEFIKNAFQSFLDVIQKVATFLRQHLGPVFDDISVGGVAATGIGFGMTATSMQIAKSFDTLATSMKVIPTTVKSVTGLLGSLKSTLGAYQKDLKADSLLKIAGAIGILAGSLVLLTLVDTKRLIGAGIALGIVGGVLVAAIGKFASLKQDAPNAFGALETIAEGLKKSMNNLTKAVKWKAIGSAIKDLGITIGIIAGAIAGLAYFYKKDPASVMASFEILKEIFKGLAAVTLAMMAIGTVFKRGAKSFALIAAGTTLLSMTLLNVVRALNKLFQMEIPTDYKKRIAILKTLLTAVAGLSVVLGLSSRMAGGSKLGALSIIAVAVLISTTVKSLQKLFKMKIPVDWPERLAMFGAIFAGLSGLMLVIGAASAVSGGGKASFATILSLGVFLYTAVSSLGKLFEMKLPEDWPVRFAMFELLFVSLGAIMVAIMTVGKDGKQALKGTAAILAMCAFLGTATMSIMVLSLIDGKKLIKGAAALGIILQSLAATMAGVGKVTDASAAKAVMAMAVLIGVVTAALGVLSLLSVESLIKSCAALGSILLALSLDFAAAGKATDMKSIAIITAMLGSMIAITGLLVILSEQPWEGVLAAGAALAAVLISYSAVFMSLSAFPTTNNKAIGAFLLATLALVPIGIALGVLANQPWLGMLAAGQAISQVVLSMSTAMLFVSVAGKLGDAALAGTKAFMIFIGAITAVVAAAGALNQIPGIQEFVSGGGDLLQKIGEALGKFVSGIGIGLASGLPQIGAYLNLFAMQMAMIPKQAGEGAVTVAKMLVALTAASVISGIANFFTVKRSFKSMGKDLVEFGGYIYDFGEKVKGINAGAVMAASMAGKMLAGLYSALPKSGGWMQKILGESMSLKEFGTELNNFSAPIVSFAKKVEGVKPEAVKGAAAAAGILAEVYKKLPKQGGWMQQILGESMSLKEFGTELNNFSAPIVSFAKKVEGVKEKSVKGAAAAASLIAELYEKLPRTGGWVQKIFGEQTDLTSFGTQLINFGAAINSFSLKVNDVKASSVRGAAAAASLIANLYDKLPQEDGWLSGLFGGETDLTEFGDELGYFGDAIAKFAEKVVSVKASDVEGAAGVTKIMADLGKNLPGKDSLSYSDFGYELEELGSSLYSFYYNIVNIDASKISSLSISLKKLIGTANAAGKDVVTKFASAVANSSKDATDAVNKLMVKALNIITKARPRFGEKGNKAASEFVSGLNSYTENAKDTITPSIELLAKYYVEGFAKGIDDNLDIATRAAAKMAREADKAVANVLDENSPSKVAEQRGKWYDEGLVIGIEKSADLPVKAAEEVATDVTEATDKNLKVTEVVDKTATGVSDGVKKISRALQPMSENFKKVGSVIQNQMSSLTISIANAYKQIEAMEKASNKHTKKLERERAEAEKLEERYNKQVEENINWLNMSAEERREQAKQNAKDAKIRAAAEIMAQEQVYGKAKKGQKEFLNTTSTYYQNLLKVKNSGNNKLLYADKTLEETEIDIWKRITDVMESYREKWESTRDEIMSQVNFFDEMASNETKTADQLMQNAKTQIDGYQRFINVQQSLAKRLKGTELAEYIAEQGIDQTDQLEVINQMTDEQLTQYADLYSQKLSLAGIAAKKQLKSFRKEVKAELRNILGGLFDKTTLDEFSKLYEKGIEAIFSGSRDDLYKKEKPKNDGEDYEFGTVGKGYEATKRGPGYEMGVNIGKNMKTGQLSTIEGSQKDISKKVNSTIDKTTKDNKPKAKKSGKTLGRAGADGVSEAVPMYYNTGAEAGRKLAEGLLSQAAAVRAAAEELRRAMALKESMEREAREAADNASIGFVEGVKRHQATILSSGISLGDGFANGVRRSLSIYSPSRVMKKLGNYATLGFIGGLLQNLASVTIAANEMAHSVTDGVQADLPRFFDDLDFNPVIVPVVDMSNVTKSIDEIQNMFNRSVGTIASNVEATAGMMNRRTSGANKMYGQHEKSDGRTGNSYVFNQYNQSPKALSSIDIYRNTKNQFAQFREAVDKA